MSLVGFRAQNHEQQVRRRGANAKVDDRETPAEIFDPLNRQFKFTIDVAASSQNAKLERYYTTKEDGLKQSWKNERVWCNPPYSDLPSWVRKAWEEMKSGCQLVVVLAPANRTEQMWWQEMIEPFRDTQNAYSKTFGFSKLRTYFLAGRPKFNIPGGYNDPRGNRPPFGCVLLIWERQ